MSADRLADLVRAARSLVPGVLSARVAVMPAGHVAVDLQVATEGDVRVAADRLGLSAPRYDSNEHNEWWHAERGDWGEERVSVVGGHKPLCQCHDIKQTA